MQGEISYDLIMEDDMSFVEGSYRTGDEVWKVFIFRKDDISESTVTTGKWPSGVSGVLVRVPKSCRLNKHIVEQVLSDRLQVKKWNEVRGPDSMQLR